MPVWRPVAAFALALCLFPTAALAAPAPDGDRDGASDRTAPSWARQLVTLKRSVAAVAEAEARGAASHAAALSKEALAAGDALLAAGPLSAHTRELYLGAQAAYERHHGPRASAPGTEGLSAAEFAALRGEALAAVTEDGAAALPLTDAERALAFDFARYPVPAGMERIMEKQRRRFTRPALYRGIQKNTARYFPMIERIFAEEGLPETLKYVAVIESGLNPHAVSHAQAGGMWQFLEETGRIYGLRGKDRFHPERSTRAAARFFHHLSERYDGDWALALAAYNCGPNRVDRLVRNASRKLGRTATYWDIYRQLPRETREYVPRAIVVAQLFG